MRRRAPLRVFVLWSRPTPSVNEPFVAFCPSTAAAPASASRRRSSPSAFAPARELTICRRTVSVRHPGGGRPLPLVTDAHSAPGSRSTRSRSSDRSCGPRPAAVVCEAVPRGRAGPSIGVRLLACLFSCRIRPHLRFGAFSRRGVPRHHIDGAVQLRLARRCSWAAACASASRSIRPPAARESERSRAPPWPAGFGAVTPARKRIS